MKIGLCVSAITMLAAASCSVSTGDSGVGTIAGSASNVNISSDAKPVVTSTPGSQAAAPADCTNLTMPGKNFIARQSFPFDFQPFRGSCFVTFGSSDDMLDTKDVPRGSTFYIFHGGKNVFEFPDAFDGQAACWVEAVGFKDLNRDGKTDVVMAGSCLAAKDSYPANAVYVNTGSGFTTYADANRLTENADTIKRIEAIVEKNLKSFFPR